MLLAAAEPVGDPLLLWRAAERLGIGRRSPARLRRTGCCDRRAREVPPSRWSAPPSTGQRHLRIAGSSISRWRRRPIGTSIRIAVRGISQLRRRVRTRKSRAELERSAARAQARGGLAAAAAFLQRAVALTVDPARRADRALAAAQASLGAGAFDVARRLLAAAEAGPLDELGRARVDLLQAEIAFAQSRGGDAPLLLLQAARKLETLDVRLSRDTYLEAWAAALFAGHWRARRQPARCLPRRGDRARSGGPPLPCDLLLDGLALIFTEGRPAATPVLRRAVAAFASAEVSVEEMLRWGWLATRAANYLWDYDSCLEIGCARSSSPATPGRSRSSPSRTTHAVRPPRSAATSRVPRC